MKATLCALVLLAALSGAAVAHEAPKKEDGSKKVQVCHHAGKSGKTKTLRIGAAALAAHREHGDTAGPCGEPPPARGPAPAELVGTPTPAPAPEPR
jgi:hypothetical protein